MMKTSAVDVRRGYRILTLYCYGCGRDRPFSQVDTWRSPQIRIARVLKGKITVYESRCPTPNIAEDVRKVRAVCMYCHKGAMYVITADRLESSHYLADLLCGCGLPLGHDGPHLDPPFIRSKKCRDSKKLNETQ